ncbi:MAG TPA: cyclic nucleotide-binding domain-containing protein [Candidatus Limnocylindria bacterium]
MLADDPLAFGPFLLLDATSRERLRASGARVSLAEGDVLIDERRDDEDAYLLTDGSVRVVAAGDDRTLAIVGAPALVGEMAIVTEDVRSATVVADTACRALRFPAAVLRALMNEQPLFASAMRERADLLLADAFLKRRSPLRDLPAEIVARLATQLRARELASDQLIEGRDDDLYLVRRGGVERMRDGHRVGAGDFVQRERGERYAAVGETSLYELRLADVAQEILRHQERVRAIATRLTEDARVRAVPGCRMVRDDELGGVLVHDHDHRAVVSDHVADLIPHLDGTRRVGDLVRGSGRPRGEIVEGLAMLVADGLAEIRSG